MELKNLRTFQAVVDQGSYQKAAEYLGYTQSTITVQIQQLEEELGVPLFERVGRRMVLNKPGICFWPPAGWPRWGRRTAPSPARCGSTWRRPCCATRPSR